MKGSICVFVNYNYLQNKLHFRVEDTGIGVKDDDVEKLFDLFGKLDSSKSMNLQGIGLGLNICKKIVNAMGGEINLDRNYKNGACFYFSLQCQRLHSGEIMMSSPNVRFDISQDNWHSSRNLLTQRSLSNETLELEDLMMPNNSYG